jgi:hypothetical protein
VSTRSAFGRRSPSGESVSARSTPPSMPCSRRFIIQRRTLWQVNNRRARAASARPCLLRRGCRRAYRRCALTLDDTVIEPAQTGGLFRWGCGQSHLNLRLLIPIAKTIEFTAMYQFGARLLAFSIGCSRLVLLTGRRISCVRWTSSRCQLAAATYQQRGTW